VKTANLKLLKGAGLRRAKGRLHVGTGRANAQRGAYCSGAQPYGRASFAVRDRFIRISKIGFSHATFAQAFARKNSTI
jgi:hypothetical protein